MIVTSMISYVKQELMIDDPLVLIFSLVLMWYPDGPKSKPW